MSNDLAPSRKPPTPMSERHLRRQCRKLVHGHRREWTRSLGREGLRAGATWFMCATVIIGGWVVVGLTWTRTEVVAAKVSADILVLGGWFALVLVGLGSGLLLAQQITTRWVVLTISLSGLLAVLVASALRDNAVIIRLPAFWVIELIAIGLTGFILSGQHHKIWVRVFTLLGMTILSALLITIGRNEQVNIATRLADNEYLQLQQISKELEAADNAPSVAAQALVAELCDLAGRDPCGEFDVTDEDQLNSCLPGWTYQAFQKWADAASIDREVAATAALARCELKAFEPGSISESGGDDAPTEVVLAEESPVPEDAEERIEEGAQAQAAIDALGAVSKAIATQRTEANLIETLGAGADGILASVSGPNEFAEFRFSGATWLVLLVLTLFWYRRLEIRAGSQGLGPVEIVYEGEPPTDGGENGSGAAPAREVLTGLHTGQAVFKQAVVQNVPEPGAVPGAQALAPVGDLISSTDVPNKWLATGFVDAIRTILATRGGYTVLYSAHQEPSPVSDHHPTSETNGTYVVFVRLRDAHSGTQQGAMRFESEYLAEAAQMAGYWVAGWIIARSRYVPEWAVWSERDAHAFYGLQWRQGDDLPLQAHGVVDPDRIQTSTNALILAQRAYAYQISPKRRKKDSDDSAPRPYTLNALEDFARAAYHQPRYPVARYRRAVALSSLMHRGVELDKAYMPRRTPEAAEKPLPSDPRLIHLFRDLIGYEDRGEKDRREADLTRWISEATSRSSTSNGKGEYLFPDDMRHAMLELSYAWLVESERSVRTGLVARLRPSERNFWREFGKTGNRRDWIALVRVSQQIAKLRLEDAGSSTTFDDDETARKLKKLRNVARRPDSHWQISYNLGCYHALLAEQLRNTAKKASEEEKESTTRAADEETQRAFDWLERCLDRPYSGQLVREWIDRDPDLHALRDLDLPDFKESWQRWRLRVPPMPVQIRQGDRSSAVKRLQMNLNHVMVSEPERRQDSLTVDGFFGTETREAVRDFQYWHDLKVTGYPDLNMLTLLETLAEVPAKKASQPDAKRKE